MRKNLPDDISVSTPELAIAVGCYFQNNGYKLSSNIHINNVKSWKEIIQIGIYQDNKELVWRNSKLSSNHFTSFYSFLDWIGEEELLIAGRKTTLSEMGVQVGCTFVPWEDVNKLIEKKEGLGY